MAQDPAVTYEKGVGVMSKQAGALVPSATINTYGASITVTPDSDNGALHPDWLALVTANVGSETITMRVTPHYADGTVGTAITIAATTSTTTAAAARDLAYVLQKDGTYITSLTIEAKSSIATTGATVSYEFAGAV